ncbi:MAG TPA: ABC transporter permease [Aggregatilineales bacterium]|nr:ABC transporter permease [Chloroflexota bacterium]HOA22549.1 ABC transporter permease [Aggregatilineales bacterium]HPV07433.1 ABC transporter permease [Aggregatilineales bacterium]HQA66965.1 ABC transporter permease [Aggregatilineales bacterium]HQE18001.1 ABC transporter permease [Aggregatilineales bacterium]
MAVSDISRVRTTGQHSPLRRSVGTVGALLRELLRRPQSAAGTLIVLFFLVLAVFGPLIAPYTANDQSHPAAQAPSAEYPFGTDHLGRDVFSRVVLGARSILLMAGLGTLIAVVLGTVVGLAIGYYGGFIDDVVSRTIDAFLALPALLVALVTLGIVRNLPLERGTFAAWLASNSVLLVIALVYVPIVARVVRSSTLDVKTREFVEAAQIRGEPAVYIMFREILPSVVPALVVEGSLRFSYAIFLVASLGFLGVGASPPTPDWGLMVNENRRLYHLTPWALLYPTFAIALLVVGVNLMSDAIKRIMQRGG